MENWMKLRIRKKIEKEEKNKYVEARCAMLAPK